MRAAVLRGTAGSLLATALVAAPAGAAPGPGGSGPGPAEARGTAVAARLAATAGIRFGTCPEVEGLPDNVRCGTVTVPLDYARPDGRKIRLTVSRVRATGTDPRSPKRAVARQGALVYNPGGPGASGMYFPLIGFLPEWKAIGAAYDLVGYAPRGVGRSAPLSCQDPEHLPKATHGVPGVPLRVVQAGADRAGEGVRPRLRAALRRRPAPLHVARQRPRPGRAARRTRRAQADLHGRLVRHVLRRAVRDAVPLPRAADGVRLARSNPDPRRSGTATTSTSRPRSSAAGGTSVRWIARHDDVYGLGGTPEEVLRSYERARARLAAAPAGGTVGTGAAPGGVPGGRVLRRLLAAQRAGPVGLPEGRPGAAGRDRRPASGGGGRTGEHPRRLHGRGVQRRALADRLAAPGTATTPGSPGWRRSRPGTTRGRTCRARTGRCRGGSRSTCGPGPERCRRRWCWPPNGTRRPRTRGRWNCAGGCPGRCW